MRDETRPRPRLRRLGWCCPPTTSTFEGTDGCLSGCPPSAARASASQDTCTDARLGLFQVRPVRLEGVPRSDRGCADRRDFSECGALSPVTNSGEAARARRSGAGGLSCCGRVSRGRQGVVAQAGDELSSAAVAGASRSSTAAHSRLPGPSTAVMSGSIWLRGPADRGCSYPGAQVLQLSLAVVTGLVPHQPV